MLGRLVLWRVGLRWYLFSLLGVPLIMVVGTMIYSGELPNLGALGGPSYLLSYLGLYVFVMVLGGPLFEEIGWRGFALPRMEPLQGPIVASVILGVLWALWHLPEFLVPSWAASSGGGLVGITLFTLTAITFTIVITWVFNNTRASVLLAILVHLIGDHVPAVKDIVSCGGGFDRVVADTKDVVAEDCEKVLVVHGSKKEVLKQEDAFFKSLPPATRKFFDTFFEEQLAPFPAG